MGSMIGSGIFLKAVSMTKELPHPGWLLAAWAIAGSLTLCGALVTAELSARFPGTGGLYVFLLRGWGRLPAYLFGWSLLAILQTGSIAGLACGLAKTLSATTGWTAGQQQGASFAFIWIITAVHCISVSLGAKWVQNVLTFTKYLGLLLLVALGLFGGEAHLSRLASPPIEMGTGAFLAAFGFCMLKTLWAYDGWVNATFIAGEVRDARRNVPRALVVGISAVIVVYLLTNAVYHLVLDPATLAASQSSPAAEVARRSGGPGWANAATTLLALSMLGSLNSSVLSAPRVYYAMATRGQFPAFMGTTTRWGTPHVSLILQAVWACVLTLAWGTFDAITDNVIFVYWIFYALAVAAALRFPQPEQGYRAPARGLLAALFLAGAGLVVFSQLKANPWSALQALALLVVGLAFYPFTRPLPEEAS